MSPVTALDSDTDNTPIKRLPRKPKREIKIASSTNNKFIVRVRRRKKSPKRKTPSATKAEMKSPRCACGYEAPSTVHKLWKQHKVTCPVSSAKGAKNIPLLRMAQSKDRKRRRKNAQQRIRQAKASLRELAAVATDDEPANVAVATTTTDSGCYECNVCSKTHDTEEAEDACCRCPECRCCLEECNCPSGSSKSSSSSTSSVASAPDTVEQVPPKPALPPTTGGKGMWGFPFPPGSTEHIECQKLMQGYQRKKAASLPERSSSSSSAASSSEDTEDRNVRGMQRAILEEAPDVVPLSVHAASNAVDTDESSEDDDTAINKAHFRGQ